MAAGRLEILAVEPWLGGSHARFLEAWGGASAHALTILGLPARHWRWRMEGGAWQLARRVLEEAPPRPDVLLVSDYLDLPRFRGFLPAWAGVPAALYLHENQLTYPGPEGRPRGARDLALGLTNILSCLVAEAVVFNSAHHLGVFRGAAREVVARLPPPAPVRTGGGPPLDPSPEPPPGPGLGADLERALEGATVVSPGIELSALPPGPGPPAGAPLRVAFNHRWERDKDPAAFLRAVVRARGKGAAIEVVLLGQPSWELPGVGELLDQLADAVRHRGFAGDRATYASLLGGCDLVVSTARHELFGMALLEGLACGCTPLAPRRLAYPEVLSILPQDLACQALYDDAGELVRRLVAAAAEPAPYREADRRRSLRAALGPHDAQRTARALDRLCEGLAALTRGSSR